MIPDYQSIMLPLLQLLGDGQPRRIRDCTELLAERFGLSPEERTRLLPSGKQPVFANRVGWARTYLKKAGLVETPTRGVVQITQRGRSLLAEGIERIDNRFLLRYEEFREFREHPRATAQHRPSSRGETTDGLDPIEQIESGYAEHVAQLRRELLDEVRKVSPSFFERLVVQLLLAMGYGGGIGEAARVVGRSGDGGIDGVINEDKLGLDVVYVQAKKWDQPVGRPEIQRFVGALHGRRARKGVFIATSSFTREAQDYAAHLDPKVVLVDGEALTRLMVEYDVGVKEKAVYRVKAIDLDFFEGES